MADVASEKGCVVEVEREGTIYRVIPEKLARDEQQAPDVDTPRPIDL